MRSAFLLLSCAAVLVAACSREAAPVAPTPAKPEAAEVKLSRSHDESSFAQPEN